MTAISGAETSNACNTTIRVVRVFLRHLVIVVDVANWGKIAGEHIIQIGLVRKESFPLSVSDPAPDRRAFLVIVPSFVSTWNRIIGR